MEIDWELEIKIFLVLFVFVDLVLKWCYKRLNCLISNLLICFWKINNFIRLDRRVIGRVKKGLRVVMKIEKNVDKRIVL